MGGRVDHGAISWKPAGGGRIVCLALACLAAPAARADPQSDVTQAIKAELDGDEARAFGLYLEAAKAGLPEAQYTIGLMYDSGRGTRRDAAEAALFYAFAASNGDARAARSLALLYRAGDGVPRNPQLAEAWFHVAGATRFPHPPTLQAAHTASPAAANLVYPAPGAVIPPDPEFVPLVWTAPPEPAPARYFIQLVALTGGAPVDLLTKTRDVSATRAPIGQRKGQYAWRVFTFCQSEGSYTATPWVRFSVG